MEQNKYLINQIFFIHSSCLLVCLISFFSLFMQQWNGFFSLLFNFFGDTLKALKPRAYLFNNKRLHKIPSYKQREKKIKSIFKNVFKRNINWYLYLLMHFTPSFQAWKVKQRRKKKLRIANRKFMCRWCRLLLQGIGSSATTGGPNHHLLHTPLKT